MTGPTKSFERINPDKLDNIETPPPGADLSNFNANNTAVLLTSNSSQYTLSSPISAFSNFTLVSLVGKETSAGEPLVTYTGTSTQGPIYYDGSQAQDNVNISNIHFDVGGADYGAHLHWWTNDSYLGDVKFSGFANSSLHGVDVSREIYGRLGPITVDALDASATPVTLDRGFYIHDTTNDVTHLPIDRPRVNMRANGTGFETSGLCNVRVDSPVIENSGQENYVLGGSQSTLVHPYSETFGANMGTPVGVQIDGNAAIIGGQFRGNATGGIGIQVSSTGSGSIRGSRFSATDVDYHIQNNSTDFWLYDLEAVSNATVTSFDCTTDAGMFNTNGSSDGPLMFIQSGEWNVRDQAGNTTTIS